MVGIVGATGAVHAIAQILSGLSREFPLPIIFVLSMSDDFLEPLVAWFADKSPLTVVAAEDGQIPQPGHVYVAGTDRYLLLEQDRLRFSDREPKVFDNMDALFRSMAQELGPGAVAVILSGMGADGAEGMKAVRDAGGYTIAQDESTSVIYGTARFAVKKDAACESLPVQRIAPRLLELVAGSSPEIL